jgi:hypothetical protein
LLRSVFREHVSYAYMKDTKRHIKGSSIIELLKFLKNYRKKKPLPPLSPATEALFSERMMPSNWYPLESLIELLDAVDKALLKGNEAAAIEMGAAGGMIQIPLIYSAMLIKGDPKSSVMSMRHMWRSHDDFGELTAEIEGDNAVVFTLTGYEDIGMVHGMMTAGWGVAAARIADSKHASVEVMERPWKGAPRFHYRILF